MHPNYDSKYLNDLADGIERPYIEVDWRTLRCIADSNREDPFILFQVCCEADVRVRRNPNSRSKKIFDEFYPIVNKYLKDLFPPDPEPIPGNGSFATTDSWPKVGLLQHLGYAVGARATSTAKRQQLLLKVFKGPIPNVVDQAYMCQWGSDASMRRLHKLAWSIASFASARLRKLSGGMDKAVADWVLDLEWLKEMIYVEHFNFPWPDIPSANTSQQWSTDLAE